MPALSSPDVRPSRGGRPRDPSRDGVIRAAILRLLADVGYGALTMDAVAAEAGVGKATIYRRWRTKEELVVDTVSDLNAAEAAARRHRQRSRATCARCCARWWALVNEPGRRRPPRRCSPRSSTTRPWPRRSATARWPCGAAPST